MTEISASQKLTSFLDSCRVLDLADEKGQFCGRVLGDLGADVIKIEPVVACPHKGYHFLC